MRHFRVIRYFPQIPNVNPVEMQHLRYLLAVDQNYLQVLDLLNELRNNHLSQENPALSNFEVILL